LQRDLSPDLNNGVTRAILRTSGKTPSTKHLFISFANQGAITSLNSLIQEPECNSDLWLCECPNYLLSFWFHLHRLVGEKTIRTGWYQTYNGRT